MYDKEFCADPIKTVGNSTKALADIEQRPKPQEIKKQSELTAVSEPKPQSKTQTPLETHSKRLEPQEKQKARVVPPQGEKSLQSENKPNIERKKINLAEKGSAQNSLSYIMVRILC